MFMSSRNKMSAWQYRMMLAAGLLAATGASVWNAGSAAADNLMAEYYLPSTNVGDAHDITGRAFFTYLTSSAQGNLQVELINDSTPDSVNDLISGVNFSISTTDQAPLVSTPHGPSAAAGQTAAPYAWSFSGGSATGPTEVTGLSPFTTATGSPELTSQLSFPWTISQTGGQYSLNSDSGAGGPGDRLGPAADASAYKYFSNINSVSGADPILAGPIFFDFTIPGLQSLDSITGVSFGYGTGGGLVSAAPAAVAAPEPAPWLLLSLGLLAGARLKRINSCKNR